MIIHDVWNRLRYGGRLRNGSLNTELQLGLGSSVELLVDGGIIAVESDVGTSRVGEALEYRIGIRGDG